jgi:hypothetical protein
MKTYPGTGFRQKFYAPRRKPIDLKSREYFALTRARCMKNLYFDHRYWSANFSQ